MGNLLNLFFTASVPDNIVLARFLGMCPLVRMSDDRSSAYGMAAAVIFVTTATTMLNWVVFNFLLLKYDIAFMKPVLFIAVIAAFVQMVEMVIRKSSPALYKGMGVFLPLITVNCAVLGSSLLVVQKELGGLDALAYSLGIGVGWSLVVIILADLKQRFRSFALPVWLAGPPVTYLILGVLSLAFVGLSGIKF